MNNQPLISILIPAYNVTLYLGDTIESVLNQSYDNYEVIIVDDGSTDNTLDIARRYESDKVRVLSQKNRGACAARNTAFSLCAGEYIQFLDGDDLLEKNKIEKQVKALKENPGYMACCPTVFFRDGCDHYTFEPQPNDLGLSSENKKPVEFLKLLYGVTNDYTSNIVSAHAWLTPRKVIERAGLWNTSLVADQDGEYFCRVVLASAGVIATPSANVFYRKNVTNSTSKGRSLSHWTSRAYAAEEKLTQLKSYVENENERVEIDKAFAISFKKIAVAAYPEFKQLSGEMLNRVSQLGGTDYIPILGGKILEAIKRVFGWRVARQLSHLRRKFRQKSI